MAELISLLPLTSDVISDACSTVHLKVFSVKGEYEAIISGIQSDVVSDHNHAIAVYAYPCRLRNKTGMRGGGGEEEGTCLAVAPCV